MKVKTMIVRRSRLRALTVVFLAFCVGGPLALGGDCGGDAALIPKAAWKVVRVDSEQPGQEAAKAFDNNRATAWQTPANNTSPGHPCEIAIDLGQSYPVVGFRYATRLHVINIPMARWVREDTGTVQEYEFFVSDDPKRFGEPVSKGAMPEGVSEKEIRFPVKGGRYVLLRALSEKSGKPLTSVAELSVLQEPPFPAIRVIEQPLSPDQVRPGGFLAARMRLNLDKLIRDRDGHTRYCGWGGAELGLWIAPAMAEASMLGMESDLHLIREKVDELVAAQDASGFYYGDKPLVRNVWCGQGLGIWGMLEYYQITKDPVVLASLLKAADLTVVKCADWEISQPLVGGIESAADPMARLGTLTRRKQYLDFARYMLDGIQHRVATPSAKPTAHVKPTELYTHEQKPFFHHAYSWLNTTRGAVSLALATGEVKYLEQAKKGFEDSFSSVWANGAFPESYGDYYERIDETCSTTEWLELALRLYAVTGESHYLDPVELAAFNGLPFAELPSGGFVTYRSINRHHWADWTVGGTNHGGEQTECCTMNGGWGLSQVAVNTITSNQNGVSVNLPFDTTAHFRWGGAEIRLAQTVVTGPHELVQSIQVENGSPEDLELKIHLPYWSGEPELQVDRVKRPLQAEDGFHRMKCPGRGTCVVRLRHPMKLQVVTARRHILNKESAEGAIGDASEKALQYGPYVLAFNREMFPKLTRQVLKELTVTVPLDGQGRPAVSQELPKDWPAEDGAIQLFLKAILQDGASVFLTPCANVTMTPLTLPDPFVMRFSEVILKR